MDKARAFGAHDLARFVVKDARLQEAVSPAHGSRARRRGPFHQGSWPVGSARRSLIQPTRHYRPRGLAWPRGAMRSWPS